ncbi:MAG: hypothetical protein [Caudoviricetes sp.]|nr:MAG: hypothetical protein [Caudoviricetes sp.]
MKIKYNVSGIALSHNDLSVYLPTETLVRDLVATRFEVNKFPLEHRDVILRKISVYVEWMQNLVDTLNEGEKFE